jgi:hypothetical protein
MSKVMKMYQASGSPLLASPQGGVAAPSNKMTRSLRSLGADGVREPYE